MASFSILIQWVKITLRMNKALHVCQINILLFPKNRWNGVIKKKLDQQDIQYKRLHLSHWADALSSVARTRKTLRSAPAFLVASLLLSSSLKNCVVASTATLFSKLWYKEIDFSSM